VERDYTNPIASTGFTVIRAAEGVSPQFLFFQVLSDEFLEPLHGLQTGSSYPAVRVRDVLAQPILLPPANEQKRIAVKLSAALSRVKRGQIAASRARERLQRHQTEIVNAAASGTNFRRLPETKSAEPAQALLRRLLTARRVRWEDSELQRLKSQGKVPKNDTWKARYVDPTPPNVDGLPTLPNGWVWASVEQLSWASGYGTSVKCTDRGIGPPVLRIPNIRDGKINLDHLKFATRSRDFRISDYVSPGDLLLVRTNGSKALIGRSAIVRTSSKEKYGFASYLIRFRMLGDEAIWSWLSLAWDSDIVRSQIEHRAKTTAGQYNVSLSGLADLAIPLPPTDTQVVIVRDVERRLLAAGRLASALDQQLERSRTTRQYLLREAIGGRLVSQDANDEPADVLLKRIRSQELDNEAKRDIRKRARGQINMTLRSAMEKPLTSEQLTAAFGKLGKRPSAERLFKEAGCVPSDVTAFYEVLRSTPVVRGAFEKAARKGPRKARTVPSSRDSKERDGGHFRLIELWLANFKNLKNYSAKFNSTYGLDVVLGWNGTGKSNLFEALVIIFRDLYEWHERNKWPDAPVNGYRLQYEMDEQLIGVHWDPQLMKRPLLTAATRARNGTDFEKPRELERTRLPLPQFVFGYYSGPTNRLAEHFQPMKQAHYIRLREAPSDDPQTLEALLSQRRFFCAETHHAKYVLLAFCYREDPEINAFLRGRLRITGFESALFIIRKPRWAKSGAKADDFWGARGVMRRVLERLRHFAVAPMVMEQTVSDGYRTAKEDHYYFFLPDLARLHAFAGEYRDARSFFLALESTDFSELISDVKIQVRVSATTKQEIPITFREMSEGEQQLLVVLGLMRFTKSAKSLVLLDEPDTHLNPHWSVDYLKLLTKLMSDTATQSNEQQTSQILVSTHDPLVIASLVKEQVHLMKRDQESGLCEWVPASTNPRGLGFTGILTSDMFGFRSDLDEDTLADLDVKVRLMAKEKDLDPADASKLEEVNKRLSEAGFQKAFSDPYYAAFVRAWGRKYSGLMAGHQFLTEAQKAEIERVAHEVLNEAIAEVEKEVSR